MEYLSIFYGALSLLSGVPILLNAKKRRRVAEASATRRLAELAGSAEELYFEERRSLEAYPPPSTDSKMRWLGFMLTVLGAAMIVMGLIDQETARMTETGSIGHVRVGIESRHAKSARLSGIRERDLRFSMAGCRDHLCPTTSPDIQLAVS